jgi:hypothetical protein
MKTIWKVDENELMALGGVAVDAAMLINELKEKLIALEQTEYPICPFCKSKMEPVNYQGYYDTFSFWECNCLLFENGFKHVGAYA